jgi:DNA-binding response OmpR family regulator
MEPDMKILVVDDDTAMTELIKLLLRPVYPNVITANGGLEALEIIHHQCPDVMILDLMMPDIDGWQVCQKIREFSNLPILILSALDTPGLVAEALNAGADDYLIKPVTSNMLVAHVNKVMRRNKMNSQTYVSHGS